MIRAVIDTNLLLRMASSGSHLPLYQAWRERRFTMVLSAALWEELVRVLTYPRVQRFCPPARGQAFLRLLHTLAVFTPLASNHPLCRDPQDHALLATAVAARPCYLVTADADIYADAGLVAALRDLEVQVVQGGEFIAALMR